MRNDSLSVSCLLAAVLFLTAAAEVPAEPWGPWSVNTDAAVLLTPADREPSSRARLDSAEHSIAATPFLWLLKIYQNVISPLDGDRCAMYPTCSQYGVLAIRKHGPVIGIIMTSDRLIHEADEQRYAPLIEVGNRYRYDDPLKDNDFWWYRP